MMIRRNQGKRRQERQQTQQAWERLEILGNRGRYAPPPRDECEERKAPYMLHIAQAYPQVRQWRQAGRLVEFAIQLDDALGRRVLEIDCKHGHVHAHHFAADGSKGDPVHIYPLEEVTDLNEGLRLAITYVVNHAERSR